MAASHVFAGHGGKDKRLRPHTLARARAPLHVRAHQAHTRTNSTTDVHQHHLGSLSLPLPSCLSPRSLIVVTVEAVLSHRAAVVCCRSRFSLSQSSAAHSQHLAPLEKHLSKVSNSAY